METTEIIQKINKVPKNFLQSVSDYIDYILEKAKREAKKEFPKQRVLGLGKGEAWIAPDFDAPLEDLKEYM